MPYDKKMEVDPDRALVLKCACNYVDTGMEQNRANAGKCKCWLTLQATEKDKGRLETVMDDPNFEFEMVDIQMRR